MDGRETRRGRAMRLPLFDGQLPAAGPVHLVSDEGEEYLLVAAGAGAPGRVEDLAAEAAPRYEAWLDRDVTVRGLVLGSVIWNAEIAGEA